MKNTYLKTALLLSALSLIVAFPALIQAEINRMKFQAQGNYLLIEVLDDDLMHFEYGRGAGPGTDTPIETTDMVCMPEDHVPEGVCNTNFSGPQHCSNTPEGVVKTHDMQVEINRENLAITIIDTTKNNVVLTTISPLNLHQTWKGLSFSRTRELDVYGLGQQFLEPGNSDIDWDGRVREGGEFGNVMAGFNGGANGNTQIPVMYVVNGATYENYALFLDNVYKQRWDFTAQSQWKVEMSGEQIRFYVMTGPDLLDLRKDYLELVGHPLVPPRKMFGLWVSEFGYDNWAELEDKIRTLQENNFPVDGVVLDLQWFGGIPSITRQCGMGSLDFNPTTFPDPADTISNYVDRLGIGVMLIEEAYICQNLPEFTRLNDQGCLVKRSPGSSEPVSFQGDWWGSGSMLDYTNDACSRYWHDTERQKLIDAGIIGHWTDLGEPEMYRSEAGYAAGTQADAHNIFNFRWLRGIYAGYLRNNVQQRAFMMSRSGTAGIQRFGAAMWSGDIASRLTSLAAHAANQMHMSMSGIDFYGADIGGFHRNLEGDLDEMYTQWYANGMMFDIPGRPHTENLCNCKETAPDRIGDLESNRENTRLRYRLIPYLYSLAHRAYRYGEPVMPPLAVYYQADRNVRNMGHEKLIGRDLLAAIVAKHDETERDVYLPNGTWYDWHTNEKIDSHGVWVPNVPESRHGIFRLPLYVREGALIPLMDVDDNTMNALGKRKDGSVRSELIVRAFAFDRPGTSREHSFTLYEDDGTTRAYQQGAVRETTITQTRANQDTVTVAVAASVGTYEGAPDTRNTVIELVINNPVEHVTVNGEMLPQFTTLADFMQADSGWVDAGKNSILAKSGEKDVSETKSFVFNLGEQQCTSEYTSIYVPGEGNGWRPDDHNRKLTCEKDKIWKGQIAMSVEAYKFAANGSWERNWGDDGRQDGPNFQPFSPAGIYNVTFHEEDPAHPLFELVEAFESTSATFMCENGHTTPGTSVYVVGNIPELGQWDPCKAVLLTPDGPYPTWTGKIDNLPVNTQVEWKCIQRLEDPNRCAHDVIWQPGSNNVFTTPSASEQAPDQKASL